MRGTKPKGNSEGRSVHKAPGVRARLHTIPRIDASHLAGITTLMNRQNVKADLDLGAVEKEVMGKTKTRLEKASGDPLVKYENELKDLSRDLGVDLETPFVGGGEEKVAPKQAPRAHAAPPAEDVADAGDIGNIAAVDDFDDTKTAPRRGDKKTPREVSHRKQTRERAQSVGGRPRQGSSPQEEENDSQSGSDEGSEDDGSEYTDATASEDGSEYTDATASEDSADTEDVLARLEKDLGLSLGGKGKRGKRSEAPPPESEEPEEGSEDGSEYTDGTETESDEGSADEQKSVRSERPRRDRHREARGGRSYSDSHHATRHSTHAAHASDRVAAVMASVRAEVEPAGGAAPVSTEGRAEKLQKIAALRQTLTDEDINISDVPIVTPDTPDSDVDRVLQVLELKNDRNRYSTLAEEVALGIAGTMETVFDGSRTIPVVGWRPNYRGYSNVVNVKLHRMRFETSQIVGSIIKKYRFGPTTRLVMELLPSLFLFPRQQRAQKNALGLADDPAFATNAASAAMVNIQRGDNRGKIEDI